ncbi:MAG: DUF3382 domain-containing protein [Acetobacteraceae bacterium]
MRPLRDAGLSALVALGLFGPMVGLQTTAGDGALYLLPRPYLVAGIVAARLRPALGHARLGRPHPARGRRPPTAASPKPPPAPGATSPRLCSSSPSPCRYSPRATIWTSAWSC